MTHEQNLASDNRLGGCGARGAAICAHKGLFAPGCFGIDSDWGNSLRHKIDSRAIGL